MNSEAITNAKLAYEAFAEVMGITRKWDELTAKEAEAWIRAANAGQGYRGPG